MYAEPAAQCSTPTTITTKTSCSQRYILCEIVGKFAIGEEKSTTCLARRHLKIFFLVFALHRLLLVYFSPAARTGNAEIPTGTSSFFANPSLRITVKVAIKTRIVTVEGPRGKLVKNLGHVAVNFGHASKNTISIEIHHGNRKNVATLRTVKSIISNMIIGVTKGFKYKMRYVYAHFPINVNVEQSKDTGLWEVEIRNFIGEKIVRRVVMAEGVDAVISTSQKDELVLSGNSIENVSQSAADIQQICKVRNKDIRKFLDGLYVSEKGNVVEE
ncbi:ribosomal L6 [Cordyceps militaris]|uniref:Ribosomal L6 n=1 Tax=Cordyceps militaris TaxID=73501 RepID=A0A2H4SEE5_CORMI|nr:ribosomal L6 [Cordyceps militaris]